MSKISVILFCVFVVFCQVISHTETAAVESGPNKKSILSSIFVDDIIVESTLNVRAKPGARQGRARQFEVGTKPGEPSTAARIDGSQILNLKRNKRQDLRYPYQNSEENPQNSGDNVQNEEEYSQNSGENIQNDEQYPQNSGNNFQNPQQYPQNSGNRFPNSQQYPQNSGNRFPNSQQYPQNFGNNFQPFQPFKPPRFSASNAQAQAQAFQNSGPLGGFGAAAAGAGSQGFSFDEKGFRANAGMSGSQSYNLPNGQTIALSYTGGFSVGPDGRPTISKGNSIAFSGPDGRPVPGFNRGK